MRVSAIICHPAVKWFRRALALPLAAAGLLMSVFFYLHPYLNSFSNFHAQLERLDHFRQVERFATTYLDKNGRLPDRGTLHDWFDRTFNTTYDGEYYVAGRECTATGFTRLKIDRFVISNWRGPKGTECYASPSGRHTVMPDWEIFWGTGEFRDTAVSLATGSVLLWFAWMIWPGGGLIDGRPLGLRRSLALLAGVSAVTLLAAWGSIFFVLAESAARTKMMTGQYQEAALMVVDYRNKHGRYPEQAVMDAWVLQRLPLFDNISIGQDCAFQTYKPGLTKEKDDLFILIGDKQSLADWGPVCQCYAYPSGKATFSTPDAPLLPLQWRDFLLLAGSGLMAWLAWRLWPPNLRKEDFAAAEKIQS